MRLRWVNWVLMGLLAAGLLFVIAVLGSRSIGLNGVDRWQTYHNSRFGFEFLYPKGWIVSVSPENQDGIAFVDPNHPGVEIRGSASLVGLMKDSGNWNDNPPLPLNFKTKQRIAGNLSVQIESQVSSLTVTIRQGSIEYCWRGSAPSHQFDSYYRFFSYIANQYRVLVGSQQAQENVLGARL